MSRQHADPRARSLQHLVVCVTSVRQSSLWQAVTAADVTPGMQLVPLMLETGDAAAAAHSSCAMQL